MAAQRRGLRRLLLLLAVAALLAQAAAQKPAGEGDAADKEEPDPAKDMVTIPAKRVDDAEAAQKAAAAGADKAGGGKPAADKNAADKPAADKPTKPKPEKAATTAPAPSPSPSPSPSPPPPPTPPPPPPPAYCADDPSCVTVKLILKVEGAPRPLSEGDAENIIAAVNSITGPVVFEYRASQPSAPGQLPAVDPDKLRLVDPPPKPKPKEEAKKQENNNDKNDNKGGDGGDKGGNGGNGDKGGNNGGDDGGNKNRRLLRASRALQQGGEDAVSCYNEWQFEVASDGQCTEKCNEKTANKPGATVAPETEPSPDNDQVLCCDCHYKRPEPTAEETAQDQAPAATAVGAGWWPADGTITPPPPDTQDGVYVFADGKTYPANVDNVANALVPATESGELCSTINAYGVECTGTRVMFNGTGDEIVMVRGVTWTYAVDTSGGGLTTAQIVGIAVGCAVGLVAVGAAAYFIAGCRRERAISRAAKLRTMSRKQQVDVVADSEASRWRQQYAQRMEDSMRRAEEASTRQRAQAGGPSFVEYQDKEFAKEADAEASPQLSSKRSFGRSFTLGRSPQTPPGDVADEDLLAGSELSSPPPSGGSSISKSRSLKKLFSSKK